MNNLTIYRKNVKNCFRILFMIYALTLIYVLFFYSTRMYTYNNVNLIPFKTIKLYIHYYSHFTFKSWFLNLFGNIIMFIPFGYILPIICSYFRRFIPIFILGLFTTCSVEILQNYLRVGEMDIDDVILNITGVILGFILYKIVDTIVRRYQNDGLKIVE